MAAHACVLVAHAVGWLHEALALALPALQPGVAVRRVAPDGLDDALAGACRPVVVTDALTARMQARARGWVVLLLPDDGPGNALVGQGDTWRTMWRPTFGDLVEAIGRLLALPPPSPDEP